MICSKCNSEISANSKFCQYCGNAIELNDVDSSKNYSNHRKVKSANNRLFGFRSGRWYKSLIACVYLFFMLMFFVGVLFYSDELAITFRDKMIVFISNILLWLAMFLPYLIMSNVFKLRERLPLYRSKRKSLNVFAILITSFIMFVCFGIVGGFRTQGYKDASQAKFEQQVVEEQLNQENDEQDESETQAQLQTEEPVESAVEQQNIEQQEQEMLEEQAGESLSSYLVNFEFTEVQLRAAEKLLEELGLKELHVIDYHQNEIMGILRAKIYDSDNMQLNVTFENNIIIYVELTGVMDENKAWSTREDKLDLGVGLQGQSTIDMYWDTEGGTLAYLDWDNKTLNKI